MIAGDLMSGYSEYSVDRLRQHGCDGVLSLSHSQYTNGEAPFLMKKIGIPVVSLAEGRRPARDSNMCVPSPFLYARRGGRTS